MRCESSRLRNGMNNLCSYGPPSETRFFSHFRWISGASVDPTADEVEAGRMPVTRRQSRRLEGKDKVLKFCREIGIQLEDVQRPGFIGGFKLPAQLMTMGVVMELAEYLKRHGHPRSALILCLEHLFNLNSHFNWESPQFVSRFYRLLQELTAERNQLKRKRMDMTVFYSLPFIMTADANPSRRILSLEQDVFSLKKQLERLSQRLFRFQKLVKRSRTRWNAF